METVAQGMRRSLLSLAAALLAARPPLPLPPDLSQLPLLPAVKLPNDETEPWSVEALRKLATRRRVFASVRDDDDTQADHRRAAIDLADALGEAVWLVGRTAASLAGVPPATSRDALATALLQADAIRSTPAQRIPLIKRLAGQGGALTKAVSAALRTLLAGDVGAREACDLYIDSGRESDQRTLAVLLALRRQEWRCIKPNLVNPLQRSLMEVLHLKNVDAGTLQLLLDEILKTGEPDDWSRLDEEEAVHLLQHLHGVEPEDNSRWRRMPLHRYVRGVRGTVDDRTLRIAGVGRPPPGLGVRLLDPDPTVRELYRHVPALNAHEILRMRLKDERPSTHAEPILKALYSDFQGRRRLNLSDDNETLDLLANSRWLPCRDGNSGLAPASLIDLPDELLESVAPLAKAIGKYRFPSDVNATIWPAVQDAVHEILGRPSHVRQVCRLAEALDTDAVRSIDDRHLVLSDPDDADPSLIDDAINSPLCGSHPGWSLVKYAATAVRFSTTTSIPARQSVVAVARALSAPVPGVHQVSMLQALSDVTPAPGSPSGKVFRRLLQSFARTGNFFAEVLPRIKLPTQDRHWRPAAEISLSTIGVARSHRIVEELRASLRLDDNYEGDHRIRAQLQDVQEGNVAQVLEDYFHPWNGRVSRYAVGAFLSLMGDGNDGEILALAQQWIPDDVSVEGMRRELTENRTDPCGRGAVEIRVSRLHRGNCVMAMNLLGERVPMRTDSNNETILATELVVHRSATPDYVGPQLRYTESTRCEVELRQVDPLDLTALELTALLGETIEHWAVRVLRVGRRRVQEWWARWGRGSQAEVGPVRATILAHLPLTLGQLGVQECTPLKGALKRATRAQRRRVQEPHNDDAIRDERKALDGLALLLEVPENQHFLLSRVRKKMSESGYQPESVLLELVQNADDALAEATEIEAGPLPATARQVVVRVHEHEGRQTIDFKHYGRPINDTGGVRFNSNHDREWDQDLYFMMLMNLSGKPGQAPGEPMATTTTGLFGLGFKSIHLVTDTPCIVSGFLAFSIAGGLLPVVKSVPIDPDLVPTEHGHQPTRIRLPLSDGFNVHTLTHSILSRFGATYPLIPAFARHIRKIAVDGGPCAGVSMFVGEPISEAPGWSVTRGTIELPGRGVWRLLRFRPGDAKDETVTAALVLGIHNGIPEALPSDLPFLWNVTPTNECWGHGYAISGPFKLDHGRAHVSLDHPSTQRVAKHLGDKLGTGLIALHDALEAGHGEAVGLPVSSVVLSTFVARLWHVLASGIENNEDRLRHGFLLLLHGAGRGISAWMRDRSVVPSDLSAPFRERLVPLKPGMRIEFAVRGLGDADLCAVLSQIEDLSCVAQSHIVVSSGVARRLRPLWEHGLSELDTADIFRELAEKWKHCLTPKRLHALRPFASDAIWRMTQTTQTDPWSSQLAARSVAGTLVPLPQLLIRADPRNGDSERADEILRASLAPHEHVLNDEYIVEPADVTVFLRLRGRHRIDADMIASWFIHLGEQQHSLGLRYLLRGELQHEVLQRLLTASRPSWLTVSDSVIQLLSHIQADEWERNRLLATLFPEVIQEEGVKPESSPDFFRKVQEWWNDPASQSSVIERHELRTWPRWLRTMGIKNGLANQSRDHWLALLLLGACQGLGRTTDEQSRDFLELLYRRRWWHVFLNPDEPKAWMNQLRTWQDEGTDRLEYSHWMSFFPAIYLFSRYLDQYRNLLLSAPRRSNSNLKRSLASRNDPALTGAGSQFNAPPVPLDMGLHWILRELVRMDIIDRKEHLFPDCWVPSEQVLRFLGTHGLVIQDPNASNADKAKEIYRFLERKLDSDVPHLDYAFDIPLRHIDSSPDLQLRLHRRNNSAF